MLLYASIAEAVLCYHARIREYRLPADPRRWSFGIVLRAWEDAPNKPRDEIAAVWETLTQLRDLRNHVHLFNKAGDRRGSFSWLLEHEDELLATGDNLLEHLRSLRSPAG
jgi:hypothetical protein